MLHLHRRLHRLRTCDMHCVLFQAGTQRPTPWQICGPWMVMTPFTCKAHQHCALMAPATGSLHFRLHVFGPSDHL